jgi:hypothetical protein
LLSENSIIPSEVTSHSDGKVGEFQDCITSPWHTRALSQRVTFSLFYARSDVLPRSSRSFLPLMETHLAQIEVRIDKMSFRQGLWR